jgi:2-polyprenyl-3-methyl-5-hydroxy-6-metoxy-1,4-benzoquinol methylase
LPLKSKPDTSDIPKVINDRVRTSVRVDWAAEYIVSIHYINNYISRLNVTNCLDIGCGDGRIINELSNKYKNIKFTGIDYSKRCIQIANLYKSRENVNFKQFDVLKKNDEDLELYDLIISVEVLEHIPVNDLDKFVCKNLELLSCNGKFLFIVPHINKKVIKKHYQHFSSNSVKKLICDTSNYVIEEMIFIDSVKTLKYKFTKLLNNKHYTLNILYEKYLNYLLKHKMVNEKQCGRLVCLVRKK